MLTGDLDGLGRFLDAFEPEQRDRPGHQPRAALGINFEGAVRILQGPFVILAALDQSHGANFVADLIFGVGFDRPGGSVNGQGIVVAPKATCCGFKSRPRFKLRVFHRPQERPESQRRLARHRECPAI